MSDLRPPSPAARALDEVAAAVQRAIDPAGAGWILLWSAAPTAMLDHPAAGTPRPGLGHALAESSKTLLAASSASRGSTLTMVGDVLFAYEGANPGATLQPVIEAVARAQGAAPVHHTARPSLAGLARGLQDRRRAERSAARELPAGLPEALTRALHAAVRATARATAALDALRPRLVVLASQHSTSSRSLIHAARERSIATAYLPHAPAASTIQYRDLPTDFAGLRGPREVDFYRSLGATGDLSVIGNPQGTVSAPVQLDPSAPVIFAPRPQPPAAVRAQVAAVAAAAAEVVVSPHPRMRGSDRYRELWPAHWTVHDGWTAELLRQGHPCVIQRSSGVAWEAMAHGVPVIELATDSDEPPGYLVIREPYARLCRSDADLVPAVTDARVLAADADARARLVSWATEWCAATGEVAVARAATWIGQCAVAPRPAAPLLDRWAPARAAA